MFVCSSNPICLWDICCQIWSGEQFVSSQGWEAALEASCKGNQHRDTTSNFGHCERRIAMSNLSQWLQTKTKLDRNINMTNEFHIYDGHLTFASFAKIWNVSVVMSVWHNVGQMSHCHTVPISPSSHNRIVITERHIDNQYQKHQKNGVKLVLLWGNIQIKWEGEGKSFVLNIFIVIVSHKASHRYDV